MTPATSEGPRRDETTEGSASGASEEGCSEPPERSASTRGAVQVDIQDEARSLQCEELDRLRDRCGRAVAEAMRRGGRSPEGELRVRIVGDEEMTRLHAERLGDPTTTDVLTFDLAEGAEAIDADVVVCVDAARREAAARGVALKDAVEEELLLYALHGALHCIGFDDKDDAAARRMHEAEDAVLRAIGVGAVYARGGAS